MDIKRMQMLAGLEPTQKTLVVEAFDDEDEDPDVKIAAKDKRQQEFERKNAAELKQAEKAAKEKADNAPKKTNNATDKSAPANNATKAKGRKASERGGSMRQWLKDNASATRGEFIKQAAEHGMSKAHANTMYYTLKKKLTEAWMIFHPTVGNFVLAENPYLGRYQWASLNESEGFDPLVFGSISEATKVINNFDSFGHTPGMIKKVMENGKMKMEEDTAE